MAKNRLVERTAWRPMMWVDMDVSPISGQDYGDFGDLYVLIHYNNLFNVEKQVCMYTTRLLEYLISLNKGKFDVPHPDHGDR